jgi:probable O-glycosylation ligase (exosortase A-associated)
MVLVAFATYALLNSTKRTSVFAYTWLAYNSYLALNTLVRYGMSAINLRVGASGLAASSFFGDANDFALALNIALPFAWFFMLQTKAKIFKGLLLFSAVLLVMGVVASGSRGGFITLSLTIIWIIISQSKRKLGALILAVSIITVILALAPQNYISRIQTITGSALEEGDTGYGRITLWQAGLEMMLDNPITGVGITQYMAAYGNKYHREGDKKWRVAHSTYVTIGAETGVIALLLYLYLLYTIFNENLDFRKALRTNKMEGHFLSYLSNALLASLFAFCIGSLFLNVWYYIHIYFMLALTMVIKRILVENYRFKIMNNKERNLFKAQVVTD